MNLNEAFITGRLPAYGEYSIPINDRSGAFVGFYIDLQAFHETITIQ